MFRWLFPKQETVEDEIRMCGIARSGKWPALRRRFLQAHPKCAVCDRTEGVVPHHVIPVHVNPSLELCWDNLITACEWCHFFLLHHSDWKRYNTRAWDTVNVMRAIIEGVE